MINNSCVVVKWNSKNKSYFLSKGYIFTKMGNELNVMVDDLKSGSNVLVEFVCDYCGKIFNRKWIDQIRNNKRSSTITKDACIDCKGLKIVESNLVNYGYHSVRQIPEINKKIRKSLIDKNEEIQSKSRESVMSIYGVENVFGSELIQKKIKAKNLALYGVEYHSQRKEVKKRIIKTKWEKYGKGKDSIIHLRKENHWNWKGGISSETHILKTSSEYYDWREKVYKNFNYKCVKCMSKKKINAHHIYDWKNHFDLRFNSLNGVVFCKECHTNFHKEFRQPNNYKQLLLFLKKEENVC